MDFGSVQLNCPRCGKNFTPKNDVPGRTYSCPTCKVELSRPQADIGFRDEIPMPKEIPVRLGRYLIDSEIARGGMGVVYKGRQEGLDRFVAIKMLLGGLSSNAEVLQRFYREARAAARLRHPHIVAIHEVGEHNGQPFFSMDYIQGQGLDALLKLQPLSPEQAARILRDVARAVHFAHEHGVIHRDLKPANVLIDPKGEPHVTDFGLAKDITSRSMLSVTGEVMGTPSFMSPEQAEGRVREVDRRSDIYSMGAILYRILTGKPPFEGPTIAATIYKVVHEYTTDPHRLEKRIPVEISAICMKALEKNKEDRYATAEEFARDLDCFLRGEPVSARPLSRAQLLKRKVKQQKKVVIAAGSVAAAALVAIVTLLILVGKSELDLIEEGLARPEMRLTALQSLLEGLDEFNERARAEELAVKAVMEGRDEAARRIAYAHPHPVLADAYVSHLDIEDPDDLLIVAIKILTGLKHRPAVDRMLDLLYSPSPQVRLAAVKYFQVVPHQKAFSTLAHMVTDPVCRDDVEFALQRQPQSKMLGMLNPSGSGAIGATVEMQKAIEEHNRRIEQMMNEYLTPGHQGKDKVERALLMLKNPDPEARMKAAYLLGKLKDDRAKRPLLLATRDDNRGVARLASVALEGLGAEAFADQLVEQLKHEEPGARESAAYLLGRIGVKKHRDAVEAAHKAETDPGAKEAMLDALVALR